MAHQDECLLLGGGDGNYTEDDYYDNNDDDDNDGNDALFSNTKYKVALGLKGAARLSGEDTEHWNKRLRVRNLGWAITSPRPPPLPPPPTLRLSFP